MRNQNQNKKVNYSILFKKLNNFKYATLLSVTTLLMFVVFPFNAYGQTTFQNCATSTRQIEILRFQNSLTYVPGSNITIFINPKGIYELDNQFKLYLVNGTNEVLLSTKNEFYIPILNGIIPTNTSPGNYQLRIKSKSLANTADIETVVTSGFFQVSGNSSSLQNSVLSLPTNGGGLLTLAGFIKCLNPTNNDYNIGFLDSSGITPSGLTLSISNSQGGNSAKLFKLDFNATGSTLDYQLGSEQQLQAINNLVIDPGLAIGTYLIEYTKTINGFSMSYGIIFMNNTGNTGLGNETNESVCVGNAVTFSGWKQSIANNYPGSKYKFNFGDGTPELETTHTKLFECNNILHTFND